MTALFKVARHDKPTERKIVKAATIDELISAARIKLQLTHEKYKIYTDDFTDIDEDEILMELAKAKETKAEQLTLTVVPNEIPWSTDVLLKNTSGPSTGVTNKSIPPNSSPPHQAAKETVASKSLLSSDQNDLPKIFPKFSTNIQSALQNAKSLEPGDRRSMIHTVVEYMIHDLKNTSRNTAENISKQIVRAYPKTFTAKIGNENVDGEIEALRQTIYYAVHYKKAISANTPKLSHSLDETEDESIEKPKAQDEYGCVAYLPILPSSETQESQEEKRLKLLECSKSSDAVNDEMLTLMSETYYSQRKEIHKDKDLSKIFEHWPCFYHAKTIIQHADQLLGKDTDKTWKESLKMLAKPINCWSKNSEIHREIKTKNSKRSTNTLQEGKYVRETLKNAKAHSDMLKNDEPYHKVIFGFIAKFMKEDTKFLYVLINEEVTNDELMQHVPVVNPVLMIRGQNLQDSKNVYDVIIDKNISIHAESFLNGLLVTFISYYVFGIAYPKEIEGTLETIQRLILKICPPKGTKRGGKRKATNIHPKITTMTKELEPYIEDNGSD